MTIPLSLPWNAGRAVDKRRPFSIDQTHKIYSYLCERKSYLELVLFMLGIDTMLRSIDLRHLQVADILDEDGDIADSFVFRQQKTHSTVAPAITSSTQTACATYLKAARKQKQDYLFTLPKLPGVPISTSWHRRAVKRWSEAIGLVPDNYSTHSLRRTKAMFLYRVRGVDIATIAMLLGHKSTESTLHYLGILQADAQAIALAEDIFCAKPEEDKHPNCQQGITLSQKSVQAIARQIVHLQAGEGPGKFEGKR